MRGVLEIVEDHDGDTYRAVYTVKFAGAVYVLHAFQKKSRKGVATPKHEIDLIKERLKRAEARYAEWIAKQRGKGHELKKFRFTRAAATSLPIWDCRTPRKRWPRLGSPKASPAPSRESA